MPGVNSTYLLKAALNEIRKHKGQPELDAMEFLTLVKHKMKLLELNEDLLKRFLEQANCLVFLAKPSVNGREQIR